MILPYHALLIGTANFNVNYGAANHQVTEPDAILEYCKEIGINSFDCAAGYGTYSGLFQRYQTAKIYTKIDCYQKTQAELICDLERHIADLGVNNVYSVLIHDTDKLDQTGSQVSDYLSILEESPLCERVGISCYDSKFIKSLEFSNPIIQSVSNIFWCQKKNIGLPNFEFHGRSIYLQGKLLNYEKYSSFLQLDEIRLKQLAISTDAVNPASYHILSALKRGCDKVVIGIDSANQLNEVVTALRQDQFTNITDLYFENETIGSPIKW